MVIKSRRIRATSNPTGQCGTLVMDRQLSLMELHKIAQSSPNGVFLTLPTFAFILGEHLPSRRQLGIAPAVPMGWG